MTRAFPGASYDEWKTTDPADMDPENDRQRQEDEPEYEYEDRLNPPPSIPEEPEYDPRLIITTYVHPPIPIRVFDWSAHRDGAEEPGNLMGWGETAEDAINDLLALEDEATDD